MPGPVATMASNTARTIVITVPAKNGQNGLQTRRPAICIKPALQRPSLGTIGTVRKLVPLLSYTADSLQRGRSPTLPVVVGKKPNSDIEPVVVNTKRPNSDMESVVIGSKRPSSDMENNDPYPSSASLVYQAQRKRERLTHLTAEEKLNRRKLKNRVAAQTARDRKKVRVCSLEETIRMLTKDNKTLNMENKSLRSRVETVEAENRLLKQCKEEKKEEKLKTEEESGMATALGSAVGSSTVLPSSSPHASLHIPDIDLQQILDDLLRGTEFFEPGCPPSDAVHHQQRVGELASAVDADADRVAAGVVEDHVPSEYVGGLTESDIKFELDEEPTDTDDAFISGLLPVASTGHTSQTSHLVPTSPCLPPSPVTPSHGSLATLLDVDLLDKTLEDKDDTLVSWDGGLLSAPLWEDTYTDLFDLVA